MYRVHSDRSQVTHKAKLDKFKKTEITSTIFSNHNAMTLEINHKKKTVKNKHLEAK